MGSGSSLVGSAKPPTVTADVMLPPDTELTEATEPRSEESATASSEPAANIAAL
jgi:hypothetical protein